MIESDRTAAGGTSGEAQGGDEGVPGPALAWDTLRQELDAAQVLTPAWEDLRAYLARHPGLVGPVRDTCRLAREEFGPEAQLALQVYHDPEGPDQYAALYVRLSRYQPDTMARIEKVSAATEGPGEPDGHLLVTTDFRRPGRSRAV
jgi:hypothetical protein